MQKNLRISVIKSSFIDPEKSLRYLCECYVQFVSLSIIGEILRVDVHRKILDKFDTKYHEEINDVLHNLDREIKLPIAKFDDVEIKGLDESQIKSFGKLLYDKLIEFEDSITKNLSTFN